MALRFLNSGYFAGKVGIGTESPAYKLDVNSSAFVGARIESTAAGYAPASILLESGHADSRGQGIYQYNSVSKNSWFSGVPYSTTSDDWVIAHKLETTAFNSDVAQMSNALFCVNDSGFVGIGTTTSAYKLQVYDASSSQVRITNGLATPVDLQLFASSSSYAGIGTASNHKLALRTNNTEKVTILADGNVGIGTTSPEAKLDVESEILISGTDPILRMERGDGFNSDIIKVESSTDNVIIGDTSLDEMIFEVDSGEAVRINGAGNVGIGTTSPVTKLHLYDNTATVGLSIQADNASNSDINLGDEDDINIGRIQYSHSTDSMQFRTNNAERMRINNAGNVGIGTTSPDYLLDVSGSANNADIGIRINNTFDDNDPASEPNSVLFLNAASNNGYLRVHGAPANTAAKHQIDLGSTAASSFLTFSPGSAEKMRITTLGGISFGSTGTAYGTSGQVLTSAGDASPTWETPTTGTVTGTGSVNQVAFWDGTNSLDGNDNLYWDSANNHLGIGDGTPGAKLKVTGRTRETSIYTVDINHVRNDTNVATHAMRLNVDLSGADTTTADRTNSGLFIDLDSSANGDASHEHRIRGVNSDVRFSGFSDSVQSGYFLAESNYLLGKTASIIGVFGQAVHDTSSTDGGVSNMYGVYGTSSVQDLGDVDNAFGGFFSVTISTNRGNANVGITKGVEGHIDIDKADTIVYGEMMAVSGIIDNNEGTVPTSRKQYLLKGDYQGTKGDNAYGIYTESDKHYFDGNIGIRTSSPASKLTVGENGITTKIATATIADTTSGASLTLRGGSPTIYFDRTGADPENKILMDSAGLEFKTGTLDAEGDVDFKITAGGDLQLSKGAKISNQENTDIDSAAAEVVAQVAISYTAAFFDFVVKKGANVRSGTVYACHDGTNVEFTETSTNDLGDTSDVTLSVDISGTNMRLLATVTSDDWSVKSLIRAI